MHMTITFRNILLLTIAFASVACSEFRKIQKSGDWKVKYNAALEYYDEGDYYKAGVLLEEILPIIRGTEEAELANFRHAYAYFHQKQYILSSHYFKLFTEVYGRSEYVEEAQYMYAFSLYKQSPQSSLDQTSTYEAIAAMQNFLNRYPFSEYAEKADDLIDEMQVKLERKAYDNAKLYYQLRRYKAALIAFDNFQYDYPDSKFNEEIAFLAIETAFDLAEVSIRTKQEERYQNTVDLYQKFVDKYPDSKYLKRAEKFYADSIEQLTTFADQNNKNQ
ncbi:Beta-barrel assembly machine subunit BamD [Marinoscillum furvescens DSM 4134]|uniref:Beta-barrel assembly machine subunit BamD n=2 Tax=Marinoscillum furvescens TaxID=1026 RepID=A0A3D9L0F2_MARFU|nr:Beta-barrel assembly machine subunit BamD [Marinoscillum furvescens DSM 4134]